MERRPRAQGVLTPLPALWGSCHLASQVTLHLRGVRLMPRPKALQTQKVPTSLSCRVEGLSHFLEWGGVGVLPAPLSTPVLPLAPGFGEPEEGAGEASHTVFMVADSGSIQLSNSMWT